MNNFHKQADASREIELRIYAMLAKLEAEGAVRRVHDGYEVLDQRRYKEVMGMEGPQ